MFVKVFSLVCHLFHILTGYLVHPSRGGCCDTDFSDVKDKFNDLKNDN